ncbi:hypothetical protein [Hasllibacter sp. MH4015]|uniref:hypothetical protein n=1 Tax=Hasllibacter sp. MH4015 TaxID=2854029 RepID=UPI001CD69E61|nr:hypothetical protein [Hasllibacter sp. MH4015]
MYRWVEDHLIFTPSGKFVWRCGFWARLPKRLPREEAALGDLFDERFPSSTS